MHVYCVVYCYKAFVDVITITINKSLWRHEQIISANQPLELTTASSLPAWNGVSTSTSNLQPLTRDLTFDPATMPETMGDSRVKPSRSTFHKLELDTVSRVVIELSTSYRSTVDCLAEDSETFKSTNLIYKRWILSSVIVRP